MFRQDRTNPSTAVSTWKARKDLPKANPSTAVSAWMNGGLSGEAVMTAFGGIITQYTDSGTTYRVHTFRGTGSFEVVAGSATIDYLIIGGGASGAQANNVSGQSGGGGGAGAMIAGTGDVDTASSPYAISVGEGGVSKASGSAQSGATGAASSGFGVTAAGGGYGGVNTTSGHSGYSPANGSGGGGGQGGSGGTGGTYGNDGGDGWVSSTNALHYTYSRPFSWRRCI